MDKTETFKKLFRENPQPVMPDPDNVFYLGEMKKPIYILNAHIIMNDGSLKDIDKPLRFYAVPQRGDLIYFENEKYLVNRIMYEGFKKPTSKETFYPAAHIYIIKIKSPEEFAEIMTNFPI